MTIETAPRAPVLRFLTALAGWMRFWLAAIAVAILLTLFGAFPTAISVVAMTGVLWVPIVVLILWGRLLDDLMYRPIDREQRE